MVAEHVQDASDRNATEHTEQRKKYGTVALCTVEKVGDFTATRGATFMAVISKVVAPTNPQRAADLYVEAMEMVLPDKTAAAADMMSQMQSDGLNAINMSQPHLNDMETIYRNTVDKDIKIIGFDTEWANKAIASGRDLHVKVACPYW